MCQPLQVNGECLSLRSTVENSEHLSLNLFNAYSKTDAHKGHQAVELVGEFLSSDWEFDIKSRMKRSAIDIVPLIWSPTLKLSRLR